MNVNIFYRKKSINQYSIEKVYNTLIPFFPNDILINVKEMPFISKGLFKRIINIINTALNQTDINHISGDIHYTNLLLKQRNTILTIHDVYPLYHKNVLKRFLLKLFWFKIPIYKSNTIVTVSEFSKTEILKHLNLPSNKIRVIYNCISPLFQYSFKKFNSEKPLILHIGTKENKNLNNLIDAVNSLKIELIIVGNLSFIQQQKLIDNSIPFEHFQNISDLQLFNLYQKCDILSFISIYEGFGLPIIESQSVGRPVITSNVASMPEIAGNAAILVNPFSVEEIKNGILKLINDPNLRDELIQKGLDNVKRFGPKNIADQYMKLYKEVYHQ